MPCSLNRRFAFLLACLFALRLFALPCLGQDAPPKPEEPQVAEASDEGVRAIQTFKIRDDLVASLFAAEPIVANPVAFHVDGNGRIYVCESFRQGRGVTDNRKHDQKWLNDDLAAQTVADRIAYHKKHLGEKISEYTRYDDRIRIVEDKDGDGVADSSHVFANGFNRVEDGTGAGVITLGTNVYYTCIPKLWLLSDTDGDGKADARHAMHDGYGVRVAFRGHDLHGLTIGPDGKLYYSIGDRGYNIHSDSGHFVNPDSGAIFRCNPDGSDLEVFATGLRNPQELAFDEYGNLFTGDNNSDSGDRARWVYLVEGGDTGWRMYYQYLPDRGPFNREKIWHPQNDDTPAYIVPPITNFADGPSGLAYYPGTGLSEYFNRRFFLCDFRGGPNRSGIRSFRVKSKGAFFEMVDEDQPLWNILATDVQFGPDGTLFVSDWVNGWNGLGKGRIYAFRDKSRENETIRHEVAELLRKGVAQRPLADVVGLLEHKDQRIRQMAQFALAAKGENKPLITASLTSDHQLARIHAIWGLGQIATRKNKLTTQVKDALAKLAQDGDAEIRAQAARQIGDLKISELADTLKSLLKDGSARVRYFAAMGIAKVGKPVHRKSIFELLESNNDKDPIIRHGGVMALKGIGDLKETAKAARAHPSAAVRIATVVALRKMADPAVGSFLSDADERIVLEAARAVHDVPIKSQLPALAALADSATQSDPLLRRILNANLRIGGEPRARAVAKIAAAKNLPENMKLEALAILQSWNEPSPRDRVLGNWNPLTKHDASHARTALTEVLADVMGSSPRVRDLATRVAASLGIREVIPVLVNAFRNEESQEYTRAGALTSLEKLKYRELTKLVKVGLNDKQTAVRIAATNILSRLDRSAGFKLLRTRLANGEPAERQAAVTTLAGMKGKEIDALLSNSLQQLSEGQIPGYLKLEVMEAVATRKPLQQRLNDVFKSQNDLSECLEGGDAEVGASIFFGNARANCVRCHKVGQRGGAVGPELTKIAKDKKRRYLLDAITHPSKDIAKGFESVMVADEDGKIHTGILKSEDKDSITLMTAEGRRIRILKDSIEQRRKTKSAMPEDYLKQLTKRQIRDLVEFLSTAK